MRTKHGIFIIIEDELLFDVHTLRNDGCVISSEMLKRKTKEITIKNFYVPQEQFRVSR